MSYADAPSDLLGLAALDQARADLGVVETEPNWGPEIQAYLATVGITEPANWCAAAASTWIKRAELAIGMQGPTYPSPGAKALGLQFERAGRWLTAWGLLRGVVAPGMIGVLDRAVPGAQWRGHLGIVATVSENRFTMIEGNATPKGDRVAEIERSFTDPKLLGFGVLSGPVPRRPALPFFLTTPPALLGAIYLAQQLRKHDR